MKLKSLLFVAFAGIYALSPAQCLVSSYTFNGSAVDGTGTNNGTLNGAVAAPDRNGVPNSALNFDGVNDYIQIAEDFDYPERTICVWFKAESITTTFTNIFNIDSPSLTYGFVNAAIYNPSGTDLVIVSVGGPSSGVSITHAINLNQWYHLAVVRGATDYKIYLDCELLLTTPIGTFTSSVGIDATFFGCDRQVSRFFDGSLDEAAIYNCALSTAEICDKLTGMHETKPEEETVRLYPNPVTAGSILKLDLGQTKISSIEIINAMGEKVYSSPMNISGNVNLDPAVFVPGIYFVNLKNGNTQVGVRKFVVE